MAILPELASADAINRNILAIYDNSFEATPSDTMIHMNAEMPLNHLGYVLRYHDLQDGPPTLEATRDVVAVLTMFTYNVEDTEAYFGWLDEAAKTVPRILILGEFGGPLTPGSRRRVNRVLERMGLTLTSEFVSSITSSQVTRIDPSIIGFESDLDPVPPEHSVVSRLGEDARVALEYEADILGRTMRSVAVATGPGGGYVAGPFVLHFDPVLEIKRWIVNPFEFFGRALQAEPFPIPGRHRIVWC
ncbi:hypothetical protein VQ042_00810 [Aurantimonas sp. A2-1-M11]|uniref:hypothetical protein n=1 Tax=Aurantimonas sp. A2-1-M11 TaxID=3113712 RepID=UPI002F946FA1